MANLTLTSQEFIQNSFCPLIATLCSANVDQLCRKNNLSFTELIQPFCKLTTEAYVQEPSGTSIPVKNLRLTVIDVHSQPPQPTLARRLLNESVSTATNDRATTFEIGGLLLEIPSSFPWFETWRETFLQVQFPSDHEFLKHYLGCMLVVSSKEPNPAECLSRMEEELGRMQGGAPNTLPKWFSSTSVQRYYILLHDNVDGDLKTAETVFEAMKTAYGVKNCSFLKINSQAPVPAESQLTDPWSQYVNHSVVTQLQDVNDLDLDNHIGSGEIGSSTGSLEAAQEAGESPVILHPLSPISETQHIVANNNSFDKGHVDGMNNILPRVQHGACITSEDMEQIRHLINDFCVNSLLPYIEQNISHLNYVISNKKSVSRSLLGATKRWFGSNKPGTQVNALPPTSVMYSIDSPEIQQRRLGDLYFMIHAYSLAYTAYHSAKRDFCADGAWLYYAGALEMASLSLFMQPGDTARKAHDYADESIITYLNSCRMPQFATRATLFSTECLKNRGMYGEAAKQLIRMTCEESDLRSALLLEQAAYCFLASTRPIMPRKYAFHLVLAGNRFSKSNQKKHSLRCYRQAYQVYEGKNWSLAEDHIHYTTGRMASGLKRGQEATEAFARLLPRASRQAPNQQAAFLREYLTTQQEVSAETGEVPVLPLPVVDGSSVQVLLGSMQSPPESTSKVIPASGISFERSQEESSRWYKLEEQLVNVAMEGQPIVFKQTVELLDNTTNNANPPTTYTDEVVSISVSMENPLHISLPLHNVRLLWSFIPADGGLCQDNQPELAINPNPAAISDVCDNLTIEPDSINKVVLRVTPRRVGELRITGLGYSLAGENVNPVNGRQHLVVPPRPHRRAPKDIRALDSAIDNRLKLNVVDFAPCLRVSFEGLRSELVCGELQTVYVELFNCGTRPISRIMVVSSAPHFISIGNKGPSGVCTVPLSTPFAPQQTMRVRMSLRAPDTKGSSVLHLLFYYESTLQEKHRPRYRLVRHSWPLSVYESLQVSAVASRSCSSSHKKETSNLCLRVKNNNQIHDPLLTEISLQQVSLYSRRWQMGTQAHSPKELRLEAQEIVHLVLEATKSEPTNDHRLSSVTLVPDATNASLPCTDFLVGPSPSSNESPEENSNTICRELEAALSLQSTLIVMWKGEVTENGGCKRLTEGQHHVLLERPDEQVTWPPEPAAVSTTNPSDTVRLFGAPTDMTTSSANNMQLIKQWLLTFNLLHPRTVDHDFAVNRVCIVPVRVEVQNCCESPVTVKVEANGPTSSSHKSQLYSPRSSVSFRWVGRTVALQVVEPHSREELPLAVALTAPGAYDLGSHLTVSSRHPQDGAGDFVPQTWRPETMLIVT